MSSTSRPALHEEDFLTTREAASLLGVALRTVQLWVEAGKLSAWKTRGGHRRIPRQAVESLLQRRDVLGTIEPIAAAEPATAEQRTASAAAQPLHVLVVEDEALTREIIVAMIRSWNLPLIVSAAEDAFAALIHIGRHPPDLLLTDLLMPGMDGYRMIRHLRAMPGAKPIDVVAITALAPHEVAERGILPPDVPVILKPLSFATLKELIMQRMSARLRT